ncbi:MAG TPA: adenine phosphoribosyltransferase [Gammaproteobacteria bacterium]|nr:adenine phosphoribosyltransferase [Gammaproteobacteria bacterium]
MARPAIDVEHLRALIKDVPDFPKPGIVFKDITPVLADPQGFGSAVEHLARGVAELGAEALLAIESRGFIFGAALAQRLEMPMHLVRKRGKLPRESVSIRYELEYGFDHLEVHQDAVRAGGRYLVVDDLIATGGTAAAVAELVRRQGGSVAGFAFFIELAFLEGRAMLEGAPIVSVLTY